MGFMLSKFMSCLEIMTSISLHYNLRSGMGQALYNKIDRLVFTERGKSSLCVNTNVMG